MTYLEQVKEDVTEYIKENDIEVTEDNRKELWEQLNEELLNKDSITGNISGSYTFSTCQAMEYVTENMDEVYEAMAEFGYDTSFVGEKFLNEEWEWFDVVTRCYVLPKAISEALEELEVAE